MEKALNEKFLVGTVLMDLSNAFDCIPHDLLTAKLHAYRFIQKQLHSSIHILNVGNKK